MSKQEEILSRIDKVEKYARRVRVGTALMVIAAGATLAVTLLDKSTDRSGIDFKQGIAIISILGAALVGLLSYLRGSTKISFGPMELELASSRADDEVINELVSRIEALELAPTLQGAQTSPADVASVLLPQVKSRLEEMFFAKYATAYRADAVARAIDIRFDAAIVRLRRELEAQTRRGNLSLAIGIITSFIAIAILGLLAFEPPPAELTWLVIAVHFIPKISISVFVEVFSFFFLKLYANGLNEIRAYHDEINRQVLQWVAVDAAWHSERTESKGDLSEGLLALAGSANRGRGDAKADPSPTTIKTDKLMQAVVDAVAKEVSASGKKDELKE